MRPIFSERALALLICLSATPVNSAPQSKFLLSSPDSQLAAKVPEIYTANAFGCTRGNASPPLQWIGAPAGTKNFVVTLFDSDDHNTPSGWWHWVEYDLPATTNKLPKGAGVEHSSVLPAGTKQGRTDLGNDAYHGPGPEKGDPPHRYTFTIYALNVEKLDVPPSSSGAMVVETLKEHVVGKAVFIAHYALRSWRGFGTAEGRSADDLSKRPSYVNGDGGSTTQRTCHQ